MVQKKYIIFSDLDGTLLDHNSYSFSAASEALKLISKKKVPLILVSSKTRTELGNYQKILSLGHFPFVVENGAAIFTPAGYFPDLSGYTESKDLWCYQKGAGYQELKQILAEIEHKHGHPINGFHNASAEDVGSRTGLSGSMLQAAMAREFSVPIFHDQTTEAILKKEVDAYKLNILFGGRFMHILGNIDKGLAVRFLMNAYRQKYNKATISFMAIGDSQNDLAMLREVDHPVLVRKLTGDYEPQSEIKNIIYSPMSGPAGWNHAVLEFLNAGGKNE